MNSLFSIWMQFRSGIPAHLKGMIDKLSITHTSGIHLEQLDSPMMKQFKQAKDEVPDALLFFRMGDFFELFGLDAIIASDICDLTLTSRDKSQTNPIPMAGVPVVSYKNTLKKCLDAGFKVAVCDQVEDPRFVKGIVKREITRIATPAVPGDLEDDTTKTDYSGCYLASVIQSSQSFVFAYIDCATGEFRLTSNLDLETLKQELLTIKPKEILAESSVEKKISFLLQDYQSHKNRKTLFNKIDSWLIKSEKNCKDLFLEFFNEKDFHSFGISTIDGALACIASILLYLKNTQKNIFKNIRSIEYYVAHNFLLIDDATKKNLDFFQTSHKEKQGSLFAFLNECQTAMGSRMLMRRMNYPSKNIDDIQTNLNFVEELTRESGLYLQLQKHLSHCYDIEKILSRASQKSLDTKSLFLLKLSLNFIKNINDFIASNGTKLPLLTKLINSSESLKRLLPLCDYLNTALVENYLDQLGSSTCIFAKNFSSDLDDLYELENNFNQKLNDLEQFEKTRSNISTLKIGYTRVFGYYFEISRGKLSQVPAHFQRRQTLANAERFVTSELKDLEEKSLSANEKRLTLEQELFEKTRLKILEYSKDLLLFSSLVASIDLIVNFAQLAHKYGWVKPDISNNPETELIECYHPIMKHLSTTEEEFIPNDVKFEAEKCRIHLITGPNMAGKSTLMRQVGINQFLCQIGSFVCAKKAKIGIADRILSRIGAGDHTLKNQSTFMVEMLETANILKFATHNSLLLIDEVGRGTSTYDGMSIAWAVLEHLHDTCCPRTLFSTHYHELVKVCKTKPAIVPMQLGVFVQTIQHENATSSEQLVFSRKYTEGSVGQSFGINVAMLAGLPVPVIERAKSILKPLESKRFSRHD